MGITGPAAGEAAPRANANLVLYQAANQTCKLTCIDIWSWVLQRSTPILEFISYFHFVFNAWSGIPLTTSYGEAALAFMHQAAGATD